MPLVFGRVVPVGGLEVACQLCAVVEWPELLEDDPFAFPDFEGGAKGAGDIGVECLIDFVILLFSSAAGSPCQDNRLPGTAPTGTEHRWFAMFRVVPLISSGCTFETRLS